MSLDLSGPFAFVDAHVDGAVVELKYRFGDGTPFSEHIELPAEVPDSSAARWAVRALHLVAGVSYYKTVAPTRLITEALTPSERALVVGMYDQGLREFAYRNGIAVPLPVDIDAAGPDLPESSATAEAALRAGGPGEGAMVPIGGGKDSALVASLVPDGLLFAVNPVGAHHHLAEALGRPLAVARRTLDPHLRELVELGAPNGHVPVTAITSAISVLAAITLGRREVLMGIERSADEPTLVTDAGVPVNHQYSKSSEAEALLAAVFAPTGVRYLSLLRPMTELAIGAAVARRGLANDIVSCNRVFTIWNESTHSREQRPCGDCAKCLFTALMVGPSSTPVEVAERYGRPLLDEVDHIEPVRELWSSEKPFDCVGERLEAAAAMALLGRTEAWRDQAVVVALAPEAEAMLSAAGVEPADLLRLGPLDGLPEEHRPAVAGLAEDLAKVPGLAGASR